AVGPLAPRVAMEARARLLQLPFDSDDMHALEFRANRLLGAALFAYAAWISALAGCGQAFQSDLAVDAGFHSGDARPRDRRIAADDASAELSVCGSAADPKNCGECGHDCTTLPNVADVAAVECRGGACFVPPLACAIGFAHCSSRPDDGCEASLTD